jgi:hypothetical protein
MDQSQSQSMESIDFANENMNDGAVVQSGGISTSQLDAGIMGVERVEPSYEPLKVCLDDDSSIEDGDEDMFDDDAFYFGDEDFQALLSRVPAKAPVSPNRIMMPTQTSFLPLHHTVAPTTEPIVTSEPVHCIDSAASSTTGGLTSSGPSSSGKTCSRFSIECRMLDVDFGASSRMSHECVV